MKPPTPSSKGEKKITCKKYRNHALFECRICGKSWQDHNTARKEAYQHALSTGHSVRGEIGASYYYN